MPKLLLSLPGISGWEWVYDCIAKSFLVIEKVQETGGLAIVLPELAGASIN